MKMPDDASGFPRKTLPSRVARKTSPKTPAKPEVLARAAKRKRILKKGSDAEIVKTFSEK